MVCLKYKIGDTVKIIGQTKFCEHPIGAKRTIRNVESRNRPYMYWFNEKPSAFGMYEKDLALFDNKIISWKDKLRGK